MSKAAKRAPLVAALLALPASAGPRQSSIFLSARQDAAGDGWIDLWLPAGAEVTGFHIRSLAECDAAEDSASCAEVAVFGGAGGAAEAAGQLVSAGHAFVHGVFGTCLGLGCTPIEASSARPAAAGCAGCPAGAVLLTALSVALPRAAAGTVVCLEGGRLHHPGAQPATELRRVCAPPERAATAPPRRAACDGGGGGGAPRGVAFVKTYKTGSSTLGSLLHRYADSRGLDVAVNAKALPGSRALTPRLSPGTMPKPTECLFEFHTFKPCGAEWREAQLRGRGRLGSGGAGAGSGPPKPLQLVVDHSRWQPLAEVTRRGRSAREPPPPCQAFTARMDTASGAAHRLVSDARATAELVACVRELAARQPGRPAALPRDHRSNATGGCDSSDADLAAPSAYRESIDRGLLVTLMRWPPARFTSALEQFDIPQQTGVPCAKNRRKRGGACYGQTCDRDFKFSWSCLNRTVHRFGMLATFVRCAFDRSPPAVRAAQRLADIDAVAAAAPSGAPAGAAAARDRLRARLAAQLEAARQSGPRGGAAAKPAGCDGPIARRNARRALPASMRFVQESTANTLGWPLEPRPLADNWEAVLRQRDFASTTFNWLAALARSLDLVLISEHFDESLLLLASELRLPPTELVYFSQKRRPTDRKAGRRARPQGSQPPAALAAIDPAQLRGVSGWPSAAAMEEPDGPWLWPRELDATLCAAVGRALSLPALQPAPPPAPPRPAPATSPPDSCPRRRQAWQLARHSGLRLLQRHPVACDRAPLAGQRGGDAAAARARRLSRDAGGAQGRVPRVRARRRGGVPARGAAVAALGAAPPLLVDAAGHALMERPLL